jgi:hypothetical protein
MNQQNRQVVAAPSAQDTTIPESDQSALSWYFGPGAAYFERSTFGEQIERTDRLNHVSEICDACDGLGFVELTADQIAARVKDFDDAKATENPEKRLEKWTEVCARTLCKACKRGVVATRINTSKRVPLTARPKTTSDHEPGQAPDDEALQRYARVSRRLSRMPEDMRGVLRLFFGDVGMWCASKREGRIMALYSLTPAGRKLVARGLPAEAASILNGMGVRPDQAISEHADQQRSDRKEWRATLLLRARESALVLLAKASREWEATR